MKKLHWIRKGVVESFFRYKATAIPYRKTMGFLLGFIASLLLLTSWTDGGNKLIAESTAALVFAALVGVVVVLLVFVRPNREAALDRFTWGVLVIMVLGFGAGALCFHYRDNIVWVWNQYQTINSPSRIILEALFLLGVILGFFVVRNWAKEQKDFVSSLTAVFGGAFVASIVGKLDGGPVLVDSFAAYALGFTLSGTINLIVAAHLTASYTNRKTIASRAMLDFLYGSERATLIDGYFLRHFEDDKNYAKAWLVEALIELAAFAKRRFAERVEDRRKERVARWEQPCLGELEASNRRIAEARIKLEAAANDQKKEFEDKITELEKQKQPIESAYRKLQLVDKRIATLKKAFRDNLAATEEEAQLQAKRQVLLATCQELQAVNQRIAEANARLQAAANAADADRVRTEINGLESKRQACEEACQELVRVDEELTETQAEHKAVPNDARSKELCDKIIKHETKRQRLARRCQSENRAGDDLCKNRLCYYELLAIESEVKIDRVPEPGTKIVAPDSEANRPHRTLYRRITKITEDMFRVSVSVKWQDTLEYIVAPGEYKGTFPLMGSVSGLALLARKTIVMDRDRFKNFRSKDYGKGISPDKISQQRGLDEIDFLSYISIPVVNRRGRSTENAVGILGMDTRLFLATDAELAEDRHEREPDTYSSTLTGDKLAIYASRLYEQNDKDIAYLEQITKIVVSVLELYLKCRIGAT